MKKTIIVIMLICLSALLCACGNTSSDKKAENSMETKNERDIHRIKETEDSNTNNTEQSVPESSVIEETEAVIDIDLVGTRWKDDEAEYYYFFGKR